jgi:hypothetical protein
MTIINNCEWNKANNIGHRSSVSSLLPSRYGAKKYLNLNSFLFTTIYFITLTDGILRSAKVTIVFVHYHLRLKTIFTKTIKLY